MLCDGLDRPLRFKLTTAQRHDNLTAKALLEGIKAEAVLADNNDLRKAITDMNAEAAIPSTPRSQGPHSTRRGDLQATQPHRALLQ
ncbi:hypothetical protein FBZ93_13210 [Bradyrhizobium macuxiense]|uniref:Uncharacterized protein n=1 Tax=Bradyrhizobium macuxiense TaxID=1755647 RepID=A0A560KS19_9BRAD|nr:hypothetical protein FBZ93_13210 [Bradyrhizobium macuxiense]